MVDNSLEYRLKYWATRSSVLSFARTAHSFARSLSSLTPSRVGQWMIRLLFCLCFSLFSTIVSQSLRICARGRGQSRKIQLPKREREAGGWILLYLWHLKKDMSYREKVGKGINGKTGFWQGKKRRFCVHVCVWTQEKRFNFTRVFVVDFRASMT